MFDHPPTFCPSEIAGLYPHSMEQRCHPIRPLGWQHLSQYLQTRSILNIKTKLTLVAGDPLHNTCILPIIRTNTCNDKRTGSVLEFKIDRSSARFRITLNCAISSRHAFKVFGSQGTNCLVNLSCVDCLVSAEPSSVGR